MKFLPAQLMYLLQDRRARRNIRMLSRFILLLSLIIALYSVLFHVFMLMEGQEHSWATGVYWTLTVMSTLGFGDITFQSDLGRIFSIVVLLSGIVFLLVMLPFSFIQFFYAPWLEAETQSRARQKLPDDVRDHVILVGFDPVATSLVARLVKYGREYVLLVAEVQEALNLRDQGYKALAGELDDPETYRRVRIEKAAMVVALTDDMKNTNIAFTLRELSAGIPIVATAENDESVDILRLAGASHVFQFQKMLGGFLARRIVGAGLQSAVIGRFDKLVIVEAPAMRTSLVGKTLRESGLRQATGMTVAGLWERGLFTLPRPESRIQPETVLVLVGSMEQVSAYETFLGRPDIPPEPVLILGGGRVGQAAADVLESRGVAYRIVEKNPKVAAAGPHMVLGSAADLDVLMEAGIQRAPSVFITTHSDDMNIYLTLYCRKLRPDIQIISRATLDRNIGILHTAGADLVMSSAALAGNTVFNLLSPDKVMMLTEGLNIFRIRSHRSLWGRRLVESCIRADTGCSVVAMVREDAMDINPDPEEVISGDTELVLMGDTAAESLFRRRYPEKEGGG